MRNFTFCLVLGLSIALSFSSSAQQTNDIETKSHKTIYCELFRINKFMSYNAYGVVDYGQGIPKIAELEELERKGDERVFKTVVAALNHLSNTGWELVPHHNVNVSENATMDRWLLRKKLID